MVEVTCIFYVNLLLSKCKKEEINFSVIMKPQSPDSHIYSEFFKMWDGLLSKIIAWEFIQLKRGVFLPVTLDP